MGRLRSYSKHRWARILFQNDMIWLQNPNSMPPQTLATTKLNSTSCRYDLAIDARLFEDPDMNVKLTLFVQTVDGKQRLSATKTSEFMLTLAAGQFLSSLYKLQVLLLLHGNRARTGV